MGCVVYTAADVASTVGYCNGDCILMYIPSLQGQEDACTDQDRYQLE